MNYGLYLSTSGILSAMHRQDVATNNLANINTVGFKPDFASARSRDAARIEDGLTSFPSNDLLERLGAGVMMNPTRVSFEQGALQTTGVDLDLAIQGDGFFVLRDQSAEGTDGSGGMRLTRDGRFTRDAQGRLVSSSDGLPVMSTANRPIVLPPGPVAIGLDGVIRQRGAPIARIQITDVPDRSALTKLGHGHFEVPRQQWDARSAAKGVVKQGEVEGAAVDPIAALMSVTGAAGDAERNFGMIQYHDRLMDRAINTLGRIS